MSYSGDLYRANLFKLQLEELSKETKLGTTQSAKEQRNAQLYSGLYKVDEYVRGLKNVLDSMPKSTVAVKSGDIYAGVQIHQENNFSVSISPPSSLDIVGSYLLGTTTRPNYNVDVVIEVPEGYYEDKDYAQYRYFDKRALYLSEVVRCLINSPCGQYNDVSITNYNGDELVPIALIRPTQARANKTDALARAKGLLGKYIIRVFVVPSETAFPSSKLGVSRNNVKKIEVQTEKGVLLHENVAPTPYYNQLILKDMFMKQQFYCHAAVFEVAPELGVAVSALKVWASLRQLNYRGIETLNVLEPCVKQKVQYQYTTGDFGFNGHFFASVAVHLYLNGTITSLTDSMQCLRIIFTFLVTHNFATANVSMVNNENVSVDNAILEQYHSVFDSVFLDQSGLVNIAYKITQSSANLLQHYAALALSMLSGILALRSYALPENIKMSVYSGGGNMMSEADAFSKLFTEHVIPYGIYDTMITVNLPKTAVSYNYIQKQAGYKCDKPIIADLVIKHSKPIKVLENANNANTTDVLLSSKLPLLAAYPALLLRSYPLLTRALTDRYYLAVIIPSVTNPLEFTIGLLLRSDTWNRLMDKGPSANDTIEAPLYRAFWKDQSTLRRFQDGTILETVTWNNMNYSNIQLLPSMIVEYVFKLHLLPKTSLLNNNNVYITTPNVPFYSFIFSRTSRTDTLPTGNTIQNNMSKYDMASNTTKINMAIKEVEKALNEMKELPLHIKDVQTACSASIGTYTFPPSAQTIKVHKNATVDNVNNLYHPIEVVFQFSSSGKWPEDLVAINRIKTAFYIKIGTLLQMKHNYICSITANFIDVIVNGFALRLRTYSGKELTLYKQKSMENINSIPALVSKDGNYRTTMKNLVYRPQHNRFMTSLLTQYSLLGELCRLAKRWVASHFFNRYLNEELVELICCRVFVAPQPYTVPNSIVTAFIRFLHILSFHDWENQPLVVPSVVFSETDTPFVYDVEQDLDHTTLGEIYTKFEMRKKSDTKSLMYIATSMDLESRIWSTKCTNPQGVHGDYDVGDNPNSFKLTSYPKVTQLQRVMAYSRVTLQALETFLAQGCHDVTQWISLFKTPLEYFDAFMIVEDRVLSEYEACQSIFLYQEKNPQKKAESTNTTTEKKQKKEYKLPADLDIKATESKSDDLSKYTVHAAFYPVQLYLQDMRKQYGHIAEFNYDTFGGRVITIKFHQPKNNQEDLLDLFGKQGEGIVKSIYSSYTDFINNIRY